MSAAKDVGTFPLVSSMAPDDTLITAQGKRITAENVSKAGNTMTFTLAAGADRWVRVATMNGYGSSCILAVTGTRVEGKFMIPLTMVVTAPIAENMENLRVVPLSPEMIQTKNPRYLFSKLRVTGAYMTKHIDLYMTDITEDVTVAVSLGCPLFTSLVTPEENPAVGTNVKEFGIDSSFFGGG